MSDRFEAVALIATPRPLFNRPSIQLATLKSYLEASFPNLNISAHHCYLKIAEAIGYQRYQQISERTWLSEAVYAALLYPDRREKIQKLYYRQATKNPGLRQIDFLTLTADVAAVSDDIIQKINWYKFDLVGFSICLCQLCASLYFIQKIKRKLPTLPIVVGGSAFNRTAYLKLMQRFPAIDFAVYGEGEIPLRRIVSHLMKPAGERCWTPTPGIITAGDKADQQPVAFNQVPDLSELPPPNFSDYFDLLESFSPQTKFFPTLPVEMSRGCWWKRTHAGDCQGGCAFCNLNLQWSGYRSKSASQIIDEIDQLTSAHRSLSVTFVDNLIPRKTGSTAFGQMKHIKKDLRMFCELRADTPKSMLIQMKQAGVEEVQIGIEALSTALLKKLNKGTTAIRNLQIMKFCEELRLVNTSNLILQFPGSDSTDVAETLTNIEFAMIFRPMQCVDFYLGLGSPVWQQHRSFGLKAVYNHPHWSVLFPKEVTRTVPFMLQSYRGDLMRQRGLWKPVREKVKQWRRNYEMLHQKSISSPILGFRDGRDFLIIRHRRNSGETLNHRLLGASRQIYLYCQRIRKFEQIARQFPDLAPQALQAFLDEMAAKRIMFKEKGRYLSLAVRIKGAHFEE